MDSEILRFLRHLSGSAKETLIQLCLVYPDTETVRSDIDRATSSKTTIPYDDLAADFDRIVAVMNTNPRFAQLQTKDICIELIKSMISLGEANSILSNVDFIIFQRIRIPVLCLENKSVDLKIGVSAFIELSEVKIKVHRMVDWEGPSIQAMIAASALFLAVYAAFFKRD
jgi:hypothetical protein